MRERFMECEFQKCRFDQCVFSQLHQSTRFISCIFSNPTFTSCEFMKTTIQKLKSEQNTIRFLDTNANIRTDLNQLQVGSDVQNYASFSITSCTIPSLYSFLPFTSSSFSMSGSNALITVNNVQGLQMTSAGLTQTTLPLHQSSTSSYSFLNAPSIGLFEDPNGGMEWRVDGSIILECTHTNWILHRSISVDTNNNRGMGSQTGAFRRTHCESFRTGRFSSGTLSDVTDRMILNTAVFSVSSGMSANAFIPQETGVFSLGTSNERWVRLFLTNAVNLPSDVRIKKNVFPLLYALETILSLQPKSFRLINDLENETKFGFIAQDLVPLFQSVKSPSFISGDGQDTHYGLDTVSLVPILVNAVQALHTKIKQIRSVVMTQ